MKRCVVETVWVEDGTGRIPKVSRDFDYPGSSTMDITGQQAANLLPDPNVIFVEVWADDAGIAILESMPDAFIVPGTIEEIEDV